MEVLPSLKIFDGMQQACTETRQQTSLLLMCQITHKMNLKKIKFPVNWHFPSATLNKLCSTVVSAFHRREEHCNSSRLRGTKRTRLEIDHLISADTQSLKYDQMGSDSISQDRDFSRINHQGFLAKYFVSCNYRSYMSIHLNDRSNILTHIFVAFPAKKVQVITSIV